MHMPRGFCYPDEARLGETPGLLDEKKREALTEWWLAVRKGANTPNWDFVSRCEVGGREGLLLLEAKAHVGEIKLDDCCASGNLENRRSRRPQGFS
jgi:hypothetical protein